MTENFTSQADIFLQKLDQSSETLIVFAAQASLDQAALAVTLYLALQARQKKPTLLCLGETLVGHSPLVGINQAVHHLPTTGLIMSLDNSQGQIGNISCDNSADNTQLRIYVRATTGHQVPTAQSVLFTPLVATFQQIIVIGEITLQELALVGLSSLDENKIMFIAPTRILGQSGFFDLENQSYAAWGAKLLRQGAWQIDVDMATNLLMGIDEETNNFTANDIEAEVFELTAWLLRCGGKRYLNEVKNRQKNRSVPIEAIPVMPDYLQSKKERKAFYPGQKNPQIQKSVNSQGGEKINKDYSLKSFDKKNKHSSSENHQNQNSFNK